MVGRGSGRLAVGACAQVETKVRDVFNGHSNVLSNQPLLLVSGDNKFLVDMDYLRR